MCVQVCRLIGIVRFDVTSCKPLKKENKTRLYLEARVLSKVYCHQGAAKLETKIRVWVFPLILYYEA